MVFTILGNQDLIILRRGTLDRCNDILSTDTRICKFCSIGTSKLEFNYGLIC